MSGRIAHVRGRRVWDSRGRPTVEAEVELDDGAQGRAIAPAGASRGSNEAVELRDGGDRLGGFDVMLAVGNIEREIEPALQNRDAFAQDEIDARLVALDGSVDKSRLGANALIAVSLAVAHAAAASSRRPLWQHLSQQLATSATAVSLPLPEIQIFGGGAHANRRIDIQDLMVMPVGAQSFSEALAMCAEVYRAAGSLMRERSALSGVADEGGYWPLFASNEEAIETLLASIERAGYAAGDEVAISLDIAASEFGRDNRYRFGLDGCDLDSDALIAILLSWIDRYPIASVEDPLGEDDRSAWIRFTQAAGSRVQIIGDDYLVTHAGRVEQAAADRACNAVLIKPNQAGTLSETLAALYAARRSDFATIVSARSGETEDVSIVHLAIGWNAGQLKVGSIARGERTAKWNEGLRIEEALGGAAQFAGKAALAPFAAGGRH